MARRESEKLKSLRKSREYVQKCHLELQVTICQWDHKSVTVLEMKHTLAELEEFAKKTRTVGEQTYAACKNEVEWDRHQPSLQIIQQGIKKSQIEVQTILESRTPPPQASSGGPVPVPQVTVTQFKEKVELPAFNGTFSKWRAFHDLFLHKVKVENITSGASKLALLLTKLTGDAASIISSYPPTDANYQSAWEDICARYDNKREIAFSHLKEFHILQPQQEESAASVRKVLDTLKETVRSIQNLGAPPTPDLLYIFLATTKLDEETQKWWAIHTKSEFPTLEKFTKFLEARAIALMQNPSTSSTSHRKKFHFSHHSSQQSNAQSTQPSQKCTIHKTEDHGIFACHDFLTKPILKRKAIIQTHKLCYNCLSKTHEYRDCQSQFTCKVCHKKHHTLLHSDDSTQPSEAATTAPVVLGPSTTASHCTPTHPTNSVVLLGTILANVNDVKRQATTVRVFVDSGSESHFISEGCMARLGLKRKRTCVSLKGIGGVSGPAIKGEVDFSLDSLTSKYSLQIQALILPQISGLIPKATCRANWPHFQGLKLSDPQFSKAAPVDILLGAKKANHILVGKTRRDFYNSKAPVAIKTQFGWMVTGESPQTQPLTSFTVRAHHVSCTTAHHELQDSLAQFWELEESTPLPQLMSCNDVCAENHFLQHLQQNQDGSYTVQLPFRSPAPQLGNSRDAGHSRFHKLETKLQRQPEVLTEYKKSMIKYKELGFLEPVLEFDNKKDSESYYIPHHLVIKPSSTSTSHRVVYDASMKTTTGFSVNDALLTGPKLQVDLQPLLTRFRSHQVAMSADIEKFYPQTHVHLEDRDFQRFFWREAPQDPPKPSE